MYKSPTETSENNKTTDTVQPQKIPFLVRNPRNPRNPDSYTIREKGKLARILLQRVPKDSNEVNNELTGQDFNVIHQVYLPQVLFHHLIRISRYSVNSVVFSH